MNSSDHELVSTLRKSLLSLVGHAHRSEFDMDSASAVASASQSLGRAFSLLGSGLLKVDAPQSLKSVTDVVIELVESDAASRHFSWHLVPPDHLVGCASHFLQRVMSAKSTQNFEPMRTGVALLERASGATLPDSDAVIFLYLSLWQESLYENLSLRLQEAGNALLGVRNVAEAVDLLWHRGLFDEIRARLLAAVDAARVDPHEPTDADGAVVAESFSNLRWRTGPISRGDIPTLFALALPLSGSISPSHRLIGLRLVARFVETADKDAVDTHFEAVMRIARESLILLHPQVLPTALELLLQVVHKVCNSQEFLSRPDARRESVAALAFDALGRSVEKESQMEDMEDLDLVSAKALPVVVHIAGTVALLRRSSLFTALFATLFIRAAKCDDEVLGYLVSAFESAVQVAWPRIGAGRAAVIRGCVTGLMEARNTDEKRKERVENAARATLLALLRCDGARRTKVLLEALCSRAQKHLSLAPAAALFSDVLADDEVQDLKCENGQETRYGDVVHRFFPEGMENPMMNSTD